MKGMATFQEGRAGKVREGQVHLRFWGMWVARTVTCIIPFSAH